MIKMEINPMKTGNSTGSKINNKLLMLLCPESCLSAPPANIETIKSLNHHFKLMTQMIWFLIKLEARKFMLYQEKETFQNFISGN